MIEIISHIVLISLLGISFYQDWKYRAIHWIIFPLLLITAGFLFWNSYMPLETVLFNLVFLSVVIACLFLYISFKRGGLTNIFKSDLGLGDVLFLIAVAPLFVDRNYILFFITGMIISGVLHLILFANKQSTKIPLAGYLALYLIGLKGIDLFLYNDLFYTPIL